ncbi:hypothetical protein [Vibrio gallaecicus]|nr:hypothetical protein [Vibrio gallaecicus]MDN3614941.1 hypothetical protein [Vibrio gallaecicus]
MLLQKSLLLALHSKPQLVNLKIISLVERKKGKHPLNIVDAMF